MKMEHEQNSRYKKGEDKCPIQKNTIKALLLKLQKAELFGYKVYNALAKLKCKDET